jgi:D-hydroxyproline dehydrogenase subunit beta
VRRNFDESEAASLSEALDERYDVIVVGAGIVGAAVAFAVADTGRRVLVLDAAAPGGGSTAAGMGHVVVMDDSEAQFQLSLHSRRLWDALADHFDASVERDVTSTIWVAADAEELDAARAKEEFYGHRRAPARVLNASELAQREPCLRDGLAGGLLVMGDSVVYPPAAAHWFLRRAAQKEARVLHPVFIDRIESGRVHLAPSIGVAGAHDGRILEAGHVVVAAGLASLNLYPDAGLGDVLRPRKGHLAITARAPGFCRHQLVELGYLKSAHGHEASSVAFNLQPRQTGQMLVGSSRQYGVDDAAVEPAMLARMLRRAIEYVPGLADLSVTRSWAGFRPATPDSLPIIGALPEDPRTLFATGHEGLGITTSLGTADIVAALIDGREPPLDAAPFAPSRFRELAS